MDNTEKWENELVITVKVMGAVIYTISKEITNIETLKEINALCDGNDYVYTQKTETTFELEIKIEDISVDAFCEKIHRIQTIFTEKCECVDIEKELLIDAVGSLIASKTHGYAAKILAKLEEFKNKANENTDVYSLEEYYACGSVLGAFLGDALGSYVEFKYGEQGLYNKINFKKNNPIWMTDPGQVTDDSELALSIGYGLVDGTDGVNRNRIAYYSGLWYLSIPFDIGTTTRGGLCPVANPKIYEQSFHKYKKISLDNYCYFPEIFHSNMKASAKKNNSKSLSDGFLMRKTPLAAYCMLYSKSGELTQESEEHLDNCDMVKQVNNFDTELTHSHPLTKSADELYSRVITRIIYLKAHYPDFTNKKICTNVLAYLCDVITSEADEKFRDDIISLVNEGAPKYIILNAQQCYTDMTSFKNGLYLAIRALYLIANSEEVFNYESIIKQVIDLGGDTDTNAAIVGGVIGSLFGINDMPQDSLSIMVAFTPVEKYVRRFGIYSPGLSLLIVEEIFKRRRESNGNCNNISEAYSPRSLGIILNFLLK